MSAACCASWRFLNESMIFYTLSTHGDTIPWPCHAECEQEGRCVRARGSLYSRRYFEHDDEVSMSSSMATTSAGT